MIGRVWLIARREFSAFSSGATFWVALLFGPVATLAPMLLGRLALTRGVRLPPLPPLSDPAGAVRLLLALLLWLVLVTTLGMLLQAIVRERTSRSLETLISSVKPTELIMGKMLGVGGVTLMVLGSWLVSAAMGIWGLPAQSAAPALGALLAAAADPLLILQAVLLFVTGFAFYGSLIAVVGSLARDEPGAQNLARPLFGLLLMIFFGALTTAGMHAEPPAWLAFIPPLAPFLLLLKPSLVPLPLWVPVLATIFAAAAGLVWTGGRLLSGEGFAMPWIRPRKAVREPA